MRFPLHRPNYEGCAIENWLDPADLEEGEILHTVDQAVLDGALFEASTDLRFAEATSRQLPPANSCYLTAALLDVVERSVAKRPDLTSFFILWHEILWIARVRANQSFQRRAERPTARWESPERPLSLLLLPERPSPFPFPSPGPGRRNHRLKVVFDGKACSSVSPTWICKPTARAAPLGGRRVPGNSRLDCRSTSGD